MGLAHFAEKCPQFGKSLHDVQEWCVRKSGTCCGVCPNQLATVGSRAGLTAVVFFATAVVVFDGQEAPFNFVNVAWDNKEGNQAYVTTLKVTILAQALAYLLAVLQAGIRGNLFSKFHAYYALLGSLGFLAPLSAVALTPNALMYPPIHSHIQEDVPRPLSVAAVIARLNQESVKTWHATRRRSSDVEKGTSGASSSDQVFSLGQPMLAPSNQRDSRLSSRTQTSRYESDESEAALDIAHSASTTVTPSSTLRPSSQPDNSLLRISFGPDADLSLPIQRRSLFKWPDTPEFGPHDHPSRSGSGTHSASSPLLRQNHKPRRKLTKVHPGRKSKSGKFQLTEEQEELVRGLVHDQAWRRRGYIASFLALWVIWVGTFLYVVDVGGTRLFHFSQTNCQDPTGTTLLLAANITLLAIGLIVFSFFYNHWLSHTSMKPFIYSRQGTRLQKCIVPGTISLLVFSLWQILLWTAYSQAASPESSLLSTDVMLLLRFNPFLGRKAAESD
ncbi:hypothetical protein OIV83_002834 [Microbotryomycetes sp. JL201]|nr:hypothetical protein OIV83_002834 [Microbotryomycetes sp. JL201]